jgi:hypothetical protein
MRSKETDTFGAFWYGNKCKAMFIVNSYTFHTHEYMISLCFSQFNKTEATPNFDSCTIHNQQQKYISMSKSKANFCKSKQKNWRQVGSTD